MLLCDCCKKGKKGGPGRCRTKTTPPFPIHTFSKFSQFEWCKINLFLQYSKEAHGLHCLSWKLFLQLGLLYLTNELIITIKTVVSRSLELSHFVLDFPPQKWPISLFLNGVDIFTFKPFDTKILDFKTNHVFSNARRDINMWHAKFTRKS